MFITVEMLIVVLLWFGCGAVGVMAARINRRPIGFGLCIGLLLGFFVTVVPYYVGFQNACK